MADDRDKELKHLREQVAALQRRCSELLSQRRGIRYLVHDFHDKFGYAVRSTPQVPPDDEVRFRLRLISEEFVELLDAALGQGIEPSGDLTTKLHNRITSSPVRVNLPELADAMADLDYVVEGTRLTFGIDGWPVLLEVQRANMAKTNQALQTADAAKIAGVTKAQKPEGWTPPDIADVLRKQGWND